MKLENLIIGKTYRIKSKEWFEKNKNEKNEVIEDGVKFNSSEHCGKSMRVNLFTDYYGHKGEVEMHYSTEHSKYNTVHIAPFALEADPSDKKELSKEIFKLSETIKTYTYIYSSRNASGGGRGKLREMKDVTIRPGFDHEGNECLQLPGGDSSIPILWTIKKVRELVKNKKIEEGWDATKHTHITDSVEIGNVKEKMHKDFEWSSYGFG